LTPKSLYEFDKIKVTFEPHFLDSSGNEDGGMDANILQNPADPDATYREKAGKQHRGYVANVIEASGKNGSIIEDYQYEQNTHSDSQFLKETLDSMEKQAETVTVVTDGAYSGTQNEELAAEKKCTPCHHKPYRAGSRGHHG